MTFGNNTQTALKRSLAKTLGVDAVIKSKVEKTRYISDLASYGIDLGVTILDGVFGGAGAPVPYGISKTNDINAECSVFNGADGTLLYKDKYVRATDYSVPANAVIEHLNKKLGQAELIIDIQKKVAALLGNPIETPSNNEGSL